MRAREFRGLFRDVSYCRAIGRCCCASVRIAAAVAVFIEVYGGSDLSLSIRV